MTRSLDTFAGRYDVVRQWIRNHDGVSNGQGQLDPGVDPARVKKEIRDRDQFGLYDKSDVPWRASFVRAQDNLNADLKSLFFAQEKPEKLSGPKFERWVHDVGFQRDFLALRQTHEAQIQALADEMTSTPKVREAFVWSMRRQETKGEFDAAKVRKDVNSWRPHEIFSLRFGDTTIGLQGLKPTKTTTEDLVRRYLNADLDTSIQMNKFNAMFRAGNDYDGYLAGNDLSLRKDFDDPDFQRAKAA
jgi:hypothetical protein